MTNHYHLVLETVEGNLSQGMRHLNGVHTQKLNRTHHRVGHVFQGRYRAIMVEKDSYLLELMRYVVLNPVRAGMASVAGEWPWSSYGAMVGTASRPDWLQTDWVLGQFGSTHGKAVMGYMDFVRAGVGQPGVWESLRGQIYLGSEAFVERMQGLIADRSAMTEIPHAQRRPLAKPIEYYRDTIADKKSAMAAAYATGHGTIGTPPPFPRNTGHSGPHGIKHHLPHQLQKVRDLTMIILVPIVNLRTGGGINSPPPA